MSRRPRAGGPRGRRGARGRRGLAGSRRPPRPRWPNGAWVHRLPHGRAAANNLPPASARRVLPAAPRRRLPGLAGRPGPGAPAAARPPSAPGPAGARQPAAAAAWPPAAACWAGPRPLFSRGRGVRACGCAQRPVLARLPCLRAGKAEPAPPQPGGPRAPAGPAGLAARPAALPGETFPPATSSASPSAQRSLSPRPKIALGAVTQGAARRCRGLGAVGGRAAAGRRVGARDAWESRAVRWQSGCGERYSRRWSWPVSAPSAGFSHLCSLTNSYSTKRVGSCMFLIPICNETGIGARC